jgi:hypothetical protein
VHVAARDVRHRREECHRDAGRSLKTPARATSPSRSPVLAPGFPAPLLTPDKSREDAAEVAVVPGARVLSQLAQSDQLLTKPGRSSGPRRSKSPLAPIHPLSVRADLTQLYRVTIERQADTTVEEVPGL